MDIIATIEHKISDSLSELIISKEGIKIILSKEEIQEMNDILQGKQLTISVFNNAKDYNAVKTILCSNKKDKKQMNFITYNE